MTRPLTIKDAEKEFEATDKKRRAKVVRDWLFTIALLLLVFDFGLIVLEQFIDVLDKLGVL